jgi:hypothetical protein
MFVFTLFLRHSHAGRQIALPATLSCHFFELSALDVGALAVSMIKSRRQALLIYPIALAFLCKPFEAAASRAAIPMTPVARATDKELFAASRTSTNLPAQFQGQNGAVFLQAGLDNRRQSWQDVPRLRSCFDQFRTFRPSSAAFG